MNVIIGCITLIRDLILKKSRREFVTDTFTVISLMLDCDFSSWADAYAMQNTTAENVLTSVWWFSSSGNLGLVLPWSDDKLCLHLSFNGGNLRRTFWQEWVYPNAERYIGTIFFINTTRPEHFPVLKYLHRDYDHLDPNSLMFIAPPVIALTHWDQATAWDEQDIRLYLRNSFPDALYVRCNPQEWISVKNLLITACVHFSQFL